MYPSEPHSLLSRRRALQSLGALAIASPLSSMAQAPWPNRPVKVLISFPPGGSSDFVGRTLGPFLTEQLGQPFIFENKPGAGGMIAAEGLKREAPDGYTMMISNNAPFSIAPTMFKSVHYDVLKDFTHIAYLGSVFGGCVASSKLGVKTLTELVAKARANPGKITMGSSGTGSIGHIFGETFKRLAKIDLLHVPYKGAGPLRQDMLGGRVDVIFESVTGNLPYIKAGNVVPLGSASAERLSTIADVPTFREQGFDLLSENWHGLAAPHGIPAAIVERLNQVIPTLMQRKDVQEKMAIYGNFYRPMSGSEFNSYVAAQIEYWKPQIIAAGVAGQ